MTEAPVQNLDPSWSPSGKYVAFSRSGHRVSVTNSSELFQLDVVSLQASRLTQAFGGRGDKAPVYSPDSLSLAFSSDRSVNEEVYLLNLSTKTVTQLTDNPARDVEPAFAPDGTAIVFVSTRQGATELFAQNLIGLTPGPAQPVQLTFDGRSKSHPGWGATTTHPGPVGSPVRTPGGQTPAIPAAASGDRGLVSVQRLPRLRTRLILVPTASVRPARGLWLTTRPRGRFERTRRMRPVEQRAALIARRAGVRPLPISFGTLQCGTGGALVETVKLVLIVGCTSHFSRYVPTRKVRRQTGCSMSPTDVFSSIPGPVRWRSWLAERSCTWTL